MKIPDIDCVRDAYRRIKPYIHETPVVTNATLDQLTGANVFFKCENFQKVGAFKIRGATNAVLTLDNEESKRGVVTHSSGNHAAALAYAAGIRGIPAYIVMPETAPVVKINAVKHYQGMITFCKPTLESRESTAEMIVKNTGALFVHPYNDFRIIAGQGTAALELLQSTPDLDIVLAPVGGGGLLSGTALTAKSLNPQIKVYGCEPANADDAFKSLAANTIIPSKDPVTIADGLKTSLGDKTFPIIKQYVDGIILVTEKEIIDAMRFVYERMKIVIEPSSAVVVAPLLFRKIDVAHKKVGAILSGGNVDFEALFSDLRRRYDAS
ncbi:pyridoxal-phosphate dependent enzyme [candidate division KSB1 bacterium]|nr:pyridoxal-phosphate dependent enzyme [candidate division KSB1 bacterium]